MGRIYVASLAAYNAGRLHGEWIGATDDAEEMAAEIAAMLAACPAALESGVPSEEWAIHDYEEFPGLGEHASLADVATVAELLDAHDPDAVAAALANFGSIEEAATALKEHYRGSWDSLADWAEDYLEDVGTLADVPATLRYHIDFDGWARDAVMGGDIWVAEVDRQVHVFDNH